MHTWVLQMSCLHVALCVDGARALLDIGIAAAIAADLINVFEVFLPQLLLYPNPTDPLNGDAAALLMREPVTYTSRVKGKQ